MSKPPLSISHLEILYLYTTWYMPTARKDVFWGGGPLDVSSRTRTPGRLDWRVKDRGLETAKRHALEPCHPFVAPLRPSVHNTPTLCLWVHMRLAQTSIHVHHLCGSPGRSSIPSAGHHRLAMRHRTRYLDMGRTRPRSWTSARPGPSSPLTDPALPCPIPYPTLSCLAPTYVSHSCSALEMACSSIFNTAFPHVADDRVCSAVFEIVSQADLVSLGSSSF